MASSTALRDEASQNLGLRIELRREDASAALANDLERLDELWSEGLSKLGGPFLAGSQFCAADAFLVPVAGRLRTFGLEEWMSQPAKDCAAMLLELPAVKQWIEAALREPFTSELEWKEQDSIRGRTVLSDLRNAVQGTERGDETWIQVPRGEKERVCPFTSAFRKT